MTPSTSANYSLPDAITAAVLSNFAYQYGEPGVNFTQLLNSNGWNVIAAKAATGLPGGGRNTSSVVDVRDMRTHGFQILYFSH